MIKYYEFTKIPHFTVQVNQIKGSYNHSVLKKHFLKQPKDSSRRYLYYIQVCECVCVCVRVRVCDLSRSMTNTHIVINLVASDCQGCLLVSDTRSVVSPTRQTLQGSHPNTHLQQREEGDRRGGKNSENGCETMKGRNKDKKKEGRETKKKSAD